MAFTIEDVTKRARGRHPSFTGETTPNATVFRRMDDLHRELVNQTIKWNSSLLTTEETVSLPLSTFDDGHAFPAYHYLQGGTIHFADSPGGKRPLKIVPWSHRFNPGVQYPVYFLAGTMYLAGTEDDWTGVDEIVVNYVPEVTDLTDPDDNPITPDASRPVFVAEAALFMAKRGNAIDENEAPALSEFHEEAEKAWKMYQEWCGLRESRAESTHWRSVW